MNGNNSGVWGELKERDLDFLSLMELTNLCNTADDNRVAYLVELYNSRSSSLTPVEAHFVARYAERRGYELEIDENGNTIFKKATPDQVIESDDILKK